MPRNPRLLCGAMAVVGALSGLACDGTLTGMHRTRGTLPVVEEDPLPTSDPAKEGPRQIHAQHLLVMHRESKSAPPTMLRTRIEAKMRAQEALEKIKAGMTMDEAAVEYSDEPGAAQTKGDLGFFSRRQMVKKFADAAFRLKPGELSDVVETEYGFHVIKRLE